MIKENKIQKTKITKIEYKNESKLELNNERFNSELLNNKLYMIKI